ncbi:flagellar export chaperone FliS [Bacillus testis]|uniref:flagellar export chaperone FliS n=1 Tax=Bacillus testis TaxID=1622072 RepID=UPI00067F60D0|nr:flagellar export chaperone FliS [Bacillus testis]
MAANNPYKTYQQNSVTTASPAELTLMLYNGCLKFVAKAKVAISQGQIEEKNTNIQKAQKIIRELMVTLNMDMEVSHNMMTLYEFMNQRLMDANIKNSSAPLDEVEGLLVDFRDTWKQVIQKNRQQQHTGGMV